MLTSMLVNFIKRVTKFKAFVYLDDFLIQVARHDENVSPEELELRVNWILQIFKELGWKINAKSHLSPTTELQWLGKYLNTDLQRTFPTEHKIHRFCQLAVSLVEKDLVSISNLQEIKGVFQHLAPDNCRLLCRPIDFEITAAFF